MRKPESITADFNCGISMVFTPSDCGTGIWFATSSDIEIPVEDIDYFCKFHPHMHIMSKVLDGYYHPWIIFDDRIVDTEVLANHIKGWDPDAEPYEDVTLDVYWEDEESIPNKLKTVLNDKRKLLFTLLTGSALLASFAIAVASIMKRNSK